MTSRARIFIQMALVSPVFVFYGLLLYPWDFGHNRGFGWLMLFVLYAWSIFCLICGLISMGIFWKDEKRILWLVVFILGSIPAIQCFVPMLLDYLSD